jgi:hypothetical protein
MRSGACLPSIDEYGLFGMPAAAARRRCQNGAIDIDREGTSLNQCVARAAATCALIVAALGGCSSQELYSTGQGWQRNECRKLPDVQERERCMASTSRSFDDYQRESATARK